MTDKLYLDCIPFEGPDTDGEQMEKTYLYIRDLEAQADIKTLKERIGALESGDSSAEIDALKTELANLEFQLAMNGVIDAGDMKSVSIDRFDTQDAVNITSGIYADQAISI